MSYRATKSGLAAEAQAKINDKYESELGQQCLEWISQNIGESFDTNGSIDNVHCQLKDGVKLCKLIKKLKPGSSIKEEKYRKAPTMAFKQMELIGLALDEIKTFDVKDSELFQTVDLYEKGNIGQVVVCIEALGRKVGTLGPKEAKENKRYFTDEQMKAGQNVIGLQMGTNKGASQSGMNMGKTRHIMD